MTMTLLMIQIPNHIPLPKFRLFQQVKVTHDDGFYLGLILGFEWATAPDRHSDWVYTIQPVSGSLLAENEAVWEGDLSLLEEV